MTLTINGTEQTLDRILDVTGATDDEHDAVSLFGQNEQILEHIHGKMFAIPTLAAGVTVSSCVAAWTLGAKINLVTSVIAEPFDFHFLNLEDIADADVHELHIFKGATTGAGTAICFARFTKTAQVDTQTAVPIMSPLLAANQKTFVRLANLAAAASTVTISINYHTY